MSEEIDEALERAQMRFASMTDAQIALALEQAKLSPGVIICGALLKLSAQLAEARELYAREGHAKLVLLEQFAEQGNKLAIAVDALEEYTCPGLGKCPRQRMKDGSCVAAGRDCGNPAREALDTIMGR